MLVKRDLEHAKALFPLLQHPEVFPYVREKAQTLEDYCRLTEQAIIEELHGRMISRTIISEYKQPIGIINLVNIEANTGFLATWIGKPFFGKGYNHQAKIAFLGELFAISTIETVYLKIRKTNTRSLRANAKLAFIQQGKETHPTIYTKINQQDSNDNPFELFFINKANYLAYAEKNTSPFITM